MKIPKIIIAILGGIDAVFNMILPILVCALWVKYWQMEGFMSNFFYTIGFLTTLFRGFRIGWMTQ